MKTKITALFLALLLVLSLTACGGGSGTIGETYTTRKAEITLHYVEFTDTIDNWDLDNYWKPLPDDPSYRQIERALTVSNDDYIVCSFGFTAKNISKHDVHVGLVGMDDNIMLDYDNGYEFDEGNLCFRLSEDGLWQDVSGMVWTLEPLSEAKEMRAYMTVPKEVMDESKPLTLTLFGQKYDLH